MRRVDLTGKNFGRLTVLAEVAERNAHNQIKWACRCACGTELEVVGGALCTGRTKSCGCLKRDGSLKRTHGQSGTQVHQVWLGMKQRCTNPEHIGFRHYGGRGIYVCERWMNSFENFVADMGPRPQGMTIERDDNDGPYAPWNCKWATRVEQQKNKRLRSDAISYRGQSMTLKQAVAMAGTNYDAVWYRISVGWDVASAIETPIRPLRKSGAST